MFVLGLIAATLGASMMLAALVRLGSTFLRFAHPKPAPIFGAPHALGLHPESFAVSARDGVTIRGWRFHSREPALGVVIVCHPRGMNKSRVLPQVKILVEGRMDVVVFDFRGCGESDVRGTRWSGTLWDPLLDLEAVARATDAWMLERGVPAGCLGLLGCSFGGNMAIAHAGVAGRRYGALALDSTPLVRWEGMLGGILARERRGRPFERIRAHLDAVAVRAICAFTRSDDLYGLAERSARSLSTTPLLVILGERDNYFDIDAAATFVKENYAGSSSIWRIPKGRHLTNHLTAEAEYSDKLVSFFRSAFEQPAWASHTGGR